MKGAIATMTSERPALVADPDQCLGDVEGREALDDGYERGGDGDQAEVVRRQDARQD
jgi:hypothetical protein